MNVRSLDNSVSWVMVSGHMTMKSQNVRFLDNINVRPFSSEMSSTLTVECQITRYWNIRSPGCDVSDHLTREHLVTMEGQ